MTQDELLEKAVRTLQEQCEELMMFGPERMGEKTANSMRQLSREYMMANSPEKCDTCDIEPECEVLAALSLMLTIEAFSVLAETISHPVSVN